MTVMENLAAEMRGHAETADQTMRVYDKLAAGELVEATELYRSTWDEVHWVLEENSDPIECLMIMMHEDILETSYTAEDDGEPLFVLVHGTGGPHIQTTVHPDGRCDTEAWTWGFRGRSKVTSQLPNIASFLFG